MKNVLPLVAAFLIVASLTACGSAQPEISSVPSVLQATSSSAVTPAVSNSAAPASSAASEYACSVSNSPASEYTPTGDSKKDAAAALISVLESIQLKTTCGTTDSHMIAVRSAAALLNWGVGTEMAEEEIRSTVIDWMTAKGNGESVDICNKLALVDEAYKELLGDHAKELLDSAGCENAAYPWSDQPVETIEAVMTAAGLR